jgi:hypothetical protein
MALLSQISPYECRSQFKSAISNGQATGKEAEA